MASSVSKGPTPSSPRHHPVRIALFSSLVLVIGGFGFVALRYAIREHPGPKSVSSAVNGFDGQGSRPTNGALRYQPPEEGVYELKGQGKERISFPPNSQDDGTTMPASVRYINSCWRWHIDYNVAHWEEYDFCPSGNQLLLAGNRNSQSWDFGVAKVKNLADFSCPAGTVVLPENPAPGQRISWSCSGSNSAVPGRTVAATSARFVGSEKLQIAGAAISTIHQHQDVTLSGGQRGTVSEDWWFESRSGLPVRVERHITIYSSSPVGDITYNESGSWQMTSLRPRT